LFGSVELNVPQLLLKQPDADQSTPSEPMSLVTVALNVAGVPTMIGWGGAIDTNIG
jgi:hypothetical protein